MTACSNEYLTFKIVNLSLYSPVWKISVNSEYCNIFEYLFLSAKEITKVYHWREIAMNLLLLDKV